MSNFYDSAIIYLLDIEGIYVDDDHDKGGETYCGISRRAHPHWEGWPLIDRAKSNGIDVKTKFITVDGISLLNLVKYFYKKNYWDKLNLDKASNRQVAIKIFDIAVNMGTKRAPLMAQKCLNLCCKKEDPLLKVDGIIGAKTMEKINSIDSNLLLRLLTISQGDLYMQIISNNPSQKRFLNGWINRLKITIGEF